MKLSSLKDLEHLLPESERGRLAVSAPSFDDLHNGKEKIVRVLLDTKGRKGKSVTLVLGLEHNPQTIQDIAKILKQHCGAGGTVKQGTIEIQGDQRTRIIEKLKTLHYRVK